MVIFPKWGIGITECSFAMIVFDAIFPLSEPSSAEERTVIGQNSSSERPITIRVFRMKFYFNVDIALHLLWFNINTHWENNHHHKVFRITLWLNSNNIFSFELPLYSFATFKIDSSFMSSKWRQCKSKSWESSLTLNELSKRVCKDWMYWLKRGPLWLLIGFSLAFSWNSLIVSVNLARSVENSFLVGSLLCYFWITE